MQTKQQIQQLLLSAGIKPSKRLGQHFLIDLNLMRLLIDFVDISKDDIVLEVGCGTGSLTEGLAEKAGYCLAVELDERIANIAKKELAEAKNVAVVNTDILTNKNTINPTITSALKLARKKYSGRMLLVANLPYNVASPVMLNLIMTKIIVDAMYVTVQKEVADRMTAEPGSKHYGTLSIFLAGTGEVKTIKVLKPTVFWPQPKVDSAMISYVRKKEKVSWIKNMELLRDTINLFMQHRRKKVKSCTKFATGNLAEIHHWPEIFERCDIDPHSRPQQLRPEDYVAIANLSLAFIDAKIVSPLSQDN
ncbi:MAG: ribosomal RNA small subunit methyltransferase A [Planctomycetota bacterium]|nr:MAG: ribosomal RNA small subunit methyltransferase A [Planctomycetota bacterium]